MTVTEVKPDRTDRPAQVGMQVRKRNGDSRKERFERHPIIAVRMIMRHEALVTPEPVYTIPREARCKDWVGELSIQTPWRRSAR